MLESARNEAAIGSTADENERRAEDIVDQVLHAMIGIDDTGHVTDWNAQAELMFGWSAEESAGRLLEELVIPQAQRGAHRDGLQRFLETGEGPILGRRVELTALRRDGAEFPVELAVSASRLGSAWRFTAFVRDISERVEAQATVRANEERFRVISELTSDHSFRAVFEEGRSPTVEWISKKFSAGFGVSADALRALGPFDSVHPDDLPVVANSLSALLDNRPWEGELRLLGRDGNHRWVHAYTRPEWDESEGRVVGLWGAVEDVHDRKAAEDALREGEEHLRVVFEAASNGILLVHADGSIVLANKAAAQMFGHPSDQLVGRDIEQLIPDWFHRAHLSPQSGSTTDPITRPMGGGLELSALRSNGTEFPVEIGLSEVESAEGVFVAAVMNDITERKRAEERVAFQSSILEQAPNAIFTVDADRRITFWNEGASRIFGWAAEEVLGRVAEDLFIPASKPTADVLQARLSDVGWSEGEFERTRRDGSTVWVHSVTASIRDGLGTAAGSVTMAVDISDRIRAEETLRDSEERFRAVVEAAPNGILMVNEDGTIAMANRAAAAMFGYDSSDLVGSPIEHLIPDGFHDPHVDHRSGYMADPRTRPMGVGLELFAHRADGVEFPVEIGLSSVQTREGRLVAAVVTDITERRQAEHELRRSAARLEGLHEMDLALLGVESSEQIAEVGLSRLRGLISCARAAVLRFDTDAGIAVNLAVSSDVGTRLDAGTIIPLKEFGDLQSLREGTPNIVVELGDHLSPPDAVRDLLSEGVRSRVNVPLVAGGELIGSLDLAFADPGEIDDDSLEVAQEVANQLAIVLQQARLREELGRYATELEQRVAERTSDLAERNSELDSFAYSVSHDLRAPLRAMLGFAQALEEDYGPQLDDVAIDYTHRVTAAAHHMDRLIQDLLEYSRLSRSEMQVQPVDVRSALDEALERQAAELQERKAQVRIDVESSKVIGHSVTLVQVLANLIGNAAKFVEAGTVPEVTIWTEDRVAWLRVAIRDNGIGIPPEHQERIFGMLERLHGQESYPGTGIGLAIVRKGIGRMGGRAGVESLPGSGSTFWVELLRAEGAAEWRQQQ